jgi:serine/threonine protein kinase
MSNATGTAKTAESTAIPGYELREEIGRGGMGVVYRARDLAFERDVAIKVLADRVYADSVAAARFRNEARITGQLQHPGIPAAHELGSFADGKPFLAMKLVKGATLREMLDQRPTPGADRGKFVAIFEQICNAVGYAHAHHVIHRDLKPSNIMVGKFGEVQIMDWGLAKILGDASSQEETENEALATIDFSASVMETPVAGDSATRTGSILGTPAYMPPEQAGGQIRQIDARSDVFGLGAILCEILTGKPPYCAKNPNDVRLMAVRGDSLEAMEKLEACGGEPDLVTLAKRCLAFEQAKRPADGQSVADEVARIRTASEARAREAERERSAALVRVAEASKRRRQLFVAASVIGGVLVLGIIGTSYGLFRAQESTRAEREAKFKAQDAAQAERIAKELAETERSRAEKREQEAIDAVKRFGDVVADNPELKNSPQLESLRKELLKEPLAFFKLLRERLQQEENTRPETLKRLATAAYDLGNLTNSIGSKEDALLAYTEAQSIWDRLALETPGENAYGVMQANNQRGLAVMLHHTGKFPESLAAHEKARSIRAQLVKNSPNDLKLQSALALSHYDCGNLFRAMGKRNEAFDAHRAAQSIRAQLVENEPDNLEFLSGLAWSEYALGLLHAEFGDLKEALAAHERSKAFRERLVREKPTAAVYQSQLAWSLYNIAHVYEDIGKQLEALAAHSEAKQIRERLVRLQPTNTAFRSEYAFSLSKLGEIFRQGGNFNQSQEAHEQAIAVREQLVRENPKAVKYQDELASSRYAHGILLDQIGRPNEAAASFEAAISIRDRLVSENPTVPTFKAKLGWSIYHLARSKKSAGDFSAAEKLLHKAVAHQSRALNEDRRNVEYRDGLKASLRLLLEAATHLSNETLKKKTQQELVELVRSDPRFAALDERMSVVLKGEAPSDANELLSFAQRSYDSERFALSARFYAEAFQKEPILIECRKPQHAYNAACSAALGGCGRGELAETLDEASRKKLRDQANELLKNEMRRLEKLLQSTSTTEERHQVANTLEHWQKDLDLASLREKERLAELPEGERKEWEQLWLLVAATLEKAQAEVKTE